MSRWINIIWTITFVLTACLEADLYDQIDPETLSRSIGPEGGKIIFYDGSIPEISLHETIIDGILDIPSGALDEEFVFDLQYVEVQHLYTDIDVFGDTSEVVVYFGSGWELEPEVEFNLPVKFSYRVRSFDLDLAEPVCFYSPISRTKLYQDQLGDWVYDRPVELIEYEYNTDENLITIEIDATDETVYAFHNVLTLNDTISNPDDYSQGNFFCESTNIEPVIIDLKFFSTFADGNFLIIPPNSFIPPAYWEINTVRDFPLIPFEIRELDYFHAYEEFEIDGIIALPNEADYHLYHVELHSYDSEKAADLFMTVNYRYPFKMGDYANEIAIYKVDIEEDKVIEKLSTGINRSDPVFIFETQINESGTYVIGLEKEKFQKWLGGSATVSIDDGTSSDVHLFSNEDEFGCYVRCEEDACYYRIKLNRLDGLGPESTEQLRFEIKQSSDDGDLTLSEEFVSELLLPNSENITLINSSIIINEFSFDHLDIGGTLIGDIIIDAIDHDGVPLSANIQFTTKIYASSL
ncbi:hypothetical protein SAMN04488029_0868 [Reichenbachiella faecimaris]|uniref:Uncharacterized protein n=1 Tax=Reichenbachiella faecimaris TaxID=692418 RepID=A0A1W2G7C2_REIFA|nr:hypothetical protein [Reichenbachiella faecimaris]SMD32523.1 hypothetical protein SAMN04488029_0868 [Reichenbachiella faecimaris]